MKLSSTPLVWSLLSALALLPLVTNAALEKPDSYIRRHQEEQNQNHGGSRHLVWDIFNFGERGCTNDLGQCLAKTASGGFTLGEWADTLDRAQVSDNDNEFDIIGELRKVIAQASSVTPTLYKETMDEMTPADIDELSKILPELHQSVQEELDVVNALQLTEPKSGDITENDILAFFNWMHAFKDAVKGATKSTLGALASGFLFWLHDFFFKIHKKIHDHLGIKVTVTSKFFKVVVLPVLGALAILTGIVLHVASKHIKIVKILFTAAKTVVVGGTVAVGLHIIADITKINILKLLGSSLLVFEVLVIIIAGIVDIIGYLTGKVDRPFANFPFLRSSTECEAESFSCKFESFLSDSIRRLLDISFMDELSLEADMATLQAIIDQGGTQDVGDLEDGVF